MLWFLGQSWLIILVSFVLGAIVGYWWWRRWWKLHRFSESEAVTKVTREHSQVIAAKDAEIGRLRSLLDNATTAGAATGAVAGGAAAVAATDGDIDASTVGDGALDSDVATEVHDAELAAAADSGDTSADGPADEAGDAEVPTSDLVDVDAVDVPSVDAGEHADGDGIDVDAVDAPSVDITAGLAGLPAQADGAHDAAQGAGEQAVIDLTDGAVAGEGDAAGGTIAGLAGVGAAAGAAAGSDAGSDSDGGDDTAEDDLERIEGIGPRISGALKSAGIHTFARLADSDVATLQAALEAAGLRFAPSLPTWARQARLLADGDEAGFIALTENLVAGRDPGKGA